MSKRSVPVPLDQQLKAWKLPPFETEFRFHSTRRWRFDYAWPDYKVACEVDGGGFVGGRHSRGIGMEKDCEKVNEAAILGWRVLRVTPRHVRDGSALSWLERMFYKD